MRPRFKQTGHLDGLQSEIKEDLPYDMILIFFVLFFRALKVTMEMMDLMERKDLR